jgi:hypothetical protein
VGPGADSGGPKRERSTGQTSLTGPESRRFCHRHLLSRLHRLPQPEHSTFGLQQGSQAATDAARFHLEIGNSNPLLKVNVLGEMEGTVKHE